MGMPGLCVIVDALLSLAGAALLDAGLDRFAGCLPLGLVQFAVAVAVKFLDDRGFLPGKSGLERLPGGSAFSGVKMAILVGVEALQNVCAALRLAGPDGFPRSGTLV